MMNITEVLIHVPSRSRPESKLLAFATVTLDASIVIRNVRIIRGQSGTFLAMPWRRVEDACPHCRYFNVLKAKYCNECGATLPTDRVGKRADGSPMLDPHGNPQVHEDQVHPITNAARRQLEATVIGAYERELERLQEVRA